MVLSQEDDDDDDDEDHHDDGCHGDDMKSSSLSPPSPSFGAVVAADVDYTSKEMMMVENEPKKRGRPPLKATKSMTVNEKATAQKVHAKANAKPPPPPPSSSSSPPSPPSPPSPTNVPEVKRGRGRPPKKKP